MNAIEVNGLMKTFPEFSLGPITLTIPQGHVIGFIGENGAGKTTLIKLILGLLIPEAGRVTVLGEHGPELSPALKEQLGVVLEESDFHQGMRLSDIEAIYREVYSSWDEPYYQALKQRFHFPDKTPLKKYSKGMKQQLALSLALSHQAKLLILDEPLSDLDPFVRDDVIEMMREFMLRDDHTIFVSSHILSDLEKICDYIVYIHQGQIILMETLESLAEDYGLLQVESQNASKIPPEAVVGTRHHKFGTEMLVRRALFDSSWPVERASIEQIILFFRRGGDK